ncbi:MAG: electron transfer flavoprotein subunit alpha/FixB family protein, partial [Planctomycetota bacterium]
MSQILVFSEKTELIPELLGKALELKDGLNASGVCAVILEGAAAHAESLASRGADKVFVVKGGAGFESRWVSATLAAIVKECDGALIMVASTRRGRELVGRLAQKLGGVGITDVNALEVSEGKVVYERYNLGGNTVTRAEISGPTPVVSSMPKSFEPASEGSSSGSVVEFTAADENPSFTVMETKSKEGESVNLEDAKVIVCVGKGFEKKEAIGPALELAKALGGEVGCTREPATDLGWFSEERILGLSGKKAGPDLYMGVGVSGQIQHTVGIVGAKCVVVVNSNKDAPFFAQCDY